MALYRKGTAALSADGTITGTGTNWKAPLSLIRTGATIVFLSGSIPKFAVISDIVSDTEMKAIATDGDPVSDGIYVILLNDSLTVDGMAQDVAETLRYYQGKETAIQEVIDLIESLDLDELVRISEETKTAAAAAATSETNAAASATDAENLRDETAQLKADTQTIKDGAVADINTAKDSGINEISSAKDSALTDMNQVKTDVTALKDSAEASAAAADQSATDSEASKVASSGFATESKNEADRAQGIADGIDPSQYLKVERNLDDVGDKSTARSNLDVFSKEEISDLLSGYLGQIEWQEMRSALEPGTIPRDGQEVEQTGIYADLYAKAVAGKLPVCTETEWQSDPLNRGCYVLESSPGKMRLPDDNGVQPGSLKIPVKVGDGGVAANNGKMGSSALPNVISETYGYSIVGSINPGEGGNFEGQNTKTTNALNVKRGSQPGAINNYGGTTASASYGSNIELNLNRGNKIYQNGVAEVRPNRLQGCWTVRIATKATNGGSIDALDLASQISAVDASMQANVAEIKSRLGYAMLDFGTMTRGERKVLANPFGNNTPVICLAEVQRNNIAGVLGWTATGYIYNGSNGTSYGTQGTWLQGVGIVVQAGSSEMCNTNINTGLPMDTGNIGTGTANLPVRVHVWKVTQ